MTNKNNKNHIDLPPSPDEEIGYIKPRKLEEEMSESYLDYAMSVIVSRALPDVRDGLKPVHRRILYSMHELGLRHNAKYRKSATIVGDVLGKYHPHGDMAVYDSMVRMAQDFAMRYPLVDGQGNFGSMDGDSPAAYRYTEARMTPSAEELLTDIEKDTVDFMDNFDGTRVEPKVLPAKLPNLLLNGQMGIAVGMATNIPPHNLTELVDGIIALIENPRLDVEGLMNYIKGPDFPTGGAIFNAAEIREAYATGKGKIVMRAQANIEEGKKGDFKIIITELPYQINKAALVEKIADLVHEKKIIGISNLRDESDRDGVRIVVELKKDAYPQKILNSLYKLTPMQDAFNVNMLALVDGLQPKILSLKEILEFYLAHRKEVVTRRTRWELVRAEERAHILEGLKIALDHLDEVISTIKKSETKEIARENLIKKFKLSEAQTQAILDMRLSQLAALERAKIEEEYKEKKRLIAELKAILADPKKILAIIKNELLELKNRFGDERKTKIFKKAAGEFSDEDLIPNEQVVITLSAGNYIKRIPVSTYRTQGRGGKGIIGATTKEEDVIEHLLITQNHNFMLFFTNKGRVFMTKAFEIPTGSRTSKGQAIVNLIQTAPDEKVTGAITLPDFKSDHFLLMVTKKGTVKKTKIKDFENVRKSGLIAIKLDSGDELKWIRETTGNDDVVVATREGQAIRFREKDVRPMGRATRGVRGIKLRSGDQVVGADILGQENSKQILVISENGFGKRSATSLYHRQNRGGIGIKTMKITPKTGKLIGMEVVDGNTADIIVISKAGQIIRMPLKSVSTLSRSTQGVRVMKLDPGDKIASISTLSEEPEELEKAEAEQKNIPRLEFKEPAVKIIKAKEKVEPEPEPEAKPEKEAKSILKTKAATLSPETHILPKKTERKIKTPKKKSKTKPKAKARIKPRQKKFKSKKATRREKLIPKLSKKKAIKKKKMKKR